MEINNTMDIDAAKLQLNAFKNELVLKIQAIDVALAAIEQTFAPKFTELETVKAENTALITENTELKVRNSELESLEETVK